MKKKILSLALVVAMIAIIAAGSLAYFTDTDSETNTMVVGNIDIEIEENVKNANGGYEPYKNDAFVLYPVANETVYEDLNAHYNKVVRTFNTSSSEDDAYIRTIVLFEKNDMLGDDFVGDGDEDIPGLHFAYVNDPGSGLCADGKYSRGSKTELLSDTVTINGNEYYVVVFTDAKEEAIPYGDSLHTLNAVWMDANVTQEQVAGWGEKVEIIVFSQGIQSYDLTHAEAMEALGEVNQENLTKWIG